jgi:putative tricarboxylic transport membrane protein
MTIRVNDVVSGALVGALGITALTLAQGFPEIPGEPGPALFPRLAGIGLLIVAVTLIAGGWRTRHAGPWVEWPEWFSQPRRFAAVVVIIAGLAITALFIETLGFFICAPVLVGALLIALSVRSVVAIPVALVATAVVHVIFYSGLRVALPWGVFERFAW